MFLVNSGVLKQLSKWECGQISGVGCFCNAPINFIQFGFVDWLPVHNKVDLAKAFESFGDGAGVRGTSLLLEGSCF